jgi:ABC-type glutathione transport system ATPase component
VPQDGRIAFAQAASTIAGRGGPLDKGQWDMQCAANSKHQGCETGYCMTNVAPLPRADAAVPLIEFRGVSHMFGNRPVLQDINLTVNKSEFVCMVGPSGCGKTTMLRMVGGLQTAATGEVTFAGKRVAGPAREISFMFQDYSKALLPWRTAAGNVSLAL